MGCECNPALKAPPAAYTSETGPPPEFLRKLLQAGTREYFDQWNGRRMCVEKSGMAGFIH
jgi:hypothetical protein